MLMKFQNISRNNVNIQVFYSNTSMGILPTQQQLIVIYLFVLRISGFLQRKEAKEKERLRGSWI